MLFLHTYGMLCTYIGHWHYFLRTYWTMPILVIATGVFWNIFVFKFKFYVFLLLNMKEQPQAAVALILDAKMNQDIVYKLQLKIEKLLERNYLYAVLLQAFKCYLCIESFV